MRGGSAVSSVWLSAPAVGTGVLRGSVNAVLVFPSKTLPFLPFWKYPPVTPVSTSQPTSHDNNQGFPRPLPGVTWPRLCGLSVTVVLEDCTLYRFGSVKLIFVSRMHASIQVCVCRPSFWSVNKCALILGSSKEWIKHYEISDQCIQTKCVIKPWHCEVTQYIYKTLKLILMKCCFHLGLQLTIIFIVDGSDDYFLDSSSPGWRLQIAGFVISPKLSKTQRYPFYTDF